MDEQGLEEYFQPILSECFGVALSDQPGWEDHTASHEVMELQSIVRAMGPMLSEAASKGDNAHVAFACGFLAVRAARVAYITSKWPKGQKTPKE